RRFLGEVLGMPEQNIIAGGNSSLTMMFDTVSQGMTAGFGEGPWINNEENIFLCPVPGYDRHFKITEYFGIRMIPVEMTPSGPDMDAVEEYVNNNPNVKGIWCVPMYSNPQGITYSDETVRRFAALKPAAKDFRIFWDDAYCAHHFRTQKDKLLSLYGECLKNGTEDMVFMFMSTSKISFPGAGIAAMAASEKNIKMLNSRMTVQSISPDKLNQLRHVRFFKDAQGVEAHMKKMASYIRPRFLIVLDALKSLDELEIIFYSEPRGGYFISVDTLDGCAKRVCQLCKDAGLVLTSAGATFPYGIDPRDRNIRIAPTYPATYDLSKAMQLFCVCVKLASAEKLLA
ncbi:MAG: aminotransferase, partial [Acutalibacteraceae bacterium]